MALVKNRDTKPEIVVRKLIHHLGYRYRLHINHLPGRPDLVFPSRHKIIFVHGCFWHRHDCPSGHRVPKTRRKFWNEKFARNEQRDRQNVVALCGAGWEVLLIWECQTTGRHLPSLTSSIRQFLDS